MIILNKNGNRAFNSENFISAYIVEGPGPTGEETYLKIRLRNGDEFFFSHSIGIDLASKNAMKAELKAMVERINEVRA